MLKKVLKILVFSFFIWQLNAEEVEAAKCKTPQECYEQALLQQYNGDMEKVKEAMAKSNLCFDKCEYKPDPDAVLALKNITGDVTFTIGEGSKGQFLWTKPSTWFKNWDNFGENHTEVTFSKEKLEEIVYGDPNKKYKIGKRTYPASEIAQALGYAYYNYAKNGQRCNDKTGCLGGTMGHYYVINRNNSLTGHGPDTYIKFNVIKANNPSSNISEPKTPTYTPEYTIHWKVYIYYIGPEIQNFCKVKNVSSPSGSEKLIDSFTHSSINIKYTFNEYGTYRVEAFPVSNFGRENWNGRAVSYNVVVPQKYVGKSMNVPTEYCKLEVEHNLSGGGPL